MKSYGQLCGVAKALDIVGARWTLLIVRDLVLGPRRYRDLLESLPGITTNLLADRLKLLVAENLVEKRALPPPAPATVYALTARGLELEPIILALGRFGQDHLATSGGSETRSVRWAMLSLMRRYRGGLDGMRMEWEVGSQAFTVDVAPETLRVRDGRSESAELRLACDDGSLFQWISGAEGARALLDRGAFLLNGRRNDLHRLARAVGLQV